MHAETGQVSQATADTINAARARGNRVVSVGTTSLRLLESAAAEDGRLAAWSGATNIFITPGYRFRVVDALMTNFHLPRSTPVHARLGLLRLERMRAAYSTLSKRTTDSTPTATQACFFARRNDHGRRYRHHEPRWTGRGSEKLRNGIRKHRDSTGHDLCWHHPDLWELLPERTEPESAVPPWPKFMRGCIRYRQSLDAQAPDAPVHDKEFNG